MNRRNLKTSLDHAVGLRDSNPPPRSPRGGAAALRRPVPPLKVLEAIAERGDSRHPLARTPQRLPLRLPAPGRSFYARVTDLNAQAEAGVDTAGRTVVVVNTALPETTLLRVSRMAPFMAVDDAVAWHAGLAFLLASVERQYRLKNGPEDQGYALRAIPGLGRTLLALSLVTGRAAGGDAWLTWGEPRPFSFTGTPGEERFGAAARDAERFLGSAADTLLPLRRGERALVDAANDLNAAAAAVAAYRAVQADLAKTPFPTDFVAFRNYLVPVTVGGVGYEAPNATYLVAWNRLEAGAGIYDRRYAEAVSTRIEHMSQTEAQTMREELSRPSVAFLVATALGVTAAELAAVEPTVLAEWFAAAPVRSHPALAAAASLARETALLSGVHYGVIRKHLPADETTEDGDHGTMTHSAGAGVSGRSLKHTVDLLEMRQGHALAKVKFKL